MYEKFTNPSDQHVAQKAGELLWAVATSERGEISNCDSAVYRAAERAFITSVRVVYGLGAQRTRRVRDLLAEYGPYDSLAPGTGYGVYSYVAYVMTNRP
jgi:hypothetical protein